ncbi:hypothetical protein KHQ82_07400 [Mycoplasmatota bacterium]|nr:hypothetical protein KHQ82_07400 [Mycoplasmatota bacterium]
MKHIINCDATIDLKMVTNVYSLDYEFDENSLNEQREGKIKLFGRFVTDDLENIKDFESYVDFTLDFDDERYKITSLECENLNYDVVFGRGINASFDVVVDYIELEEETELIKDQVDEETDELLGELLKNRDDSFLEVEPVETNDSYIEEESNVEAPEEKESYVEVPDETISDYEVFDVEEQDEIEVPMENKVKIHGNEERLTFHMEETYTKYKVIFNANEKKIEEMARKYNKSVEDIYKENQYNISNTILIKDEID